MRFARIPMTWLAAILAVGLVGCASGVVTTSTGQVVPAATVQAQDNIADVLKVADDVYKQVRTRHDSTPVCSQIVPPPCEEPAVHTSHRLTLLASARILRSAWTGLIAWKETLDPATARLAFCDLQRGLPDLAALAVQFGLLRQPDADRWGPIVGVALAAAGGCP